jgi:hypothetical protein
MKILAGAIEKYKSFIPSDNSVNSQEIKQLIKKEKQRFPGF